MALPMDHSFDAAPAYVVYRDLQPGEPFDPTSPLLFFPPKGSDELFDALRIAFPHLKTHSERMRDAIIQFLLQERQEELLQASPAMTMDTSAPTWPSVSSSGSTSVFSSPDLVDLPTPTSFANSPQAQTPQLARPVSASKTSPPSLDQMTGVFSLSVEVQPKQRVRRKMTDAEKVEYRKRRIVKACDKCAKKKRKCPHNQTQMEVVPTSKPGPKAAKPVSHRSNKTDKQVANVQGPDSVEPFTADSFDVTAGPGTSSFQTFDDFPIFDDLFPEFTVDDLMYFEQPEANFQPQDYFMPQLSPSRRSISSGRVNHNLDAAQTQASPQQVPGGTTYSIQPGLDHNHNLQSHDSPMTADLQHQSRRSGVRVSIEAEIRNLPRGVTYAQAMPPQGGQNDGNHRSSRHGLVQQHFLTDQQGAHQPTHIPHVHEAGCGEILRVAQANGVRKERRQTPSLPQTTLRLVGTTRAVRAFAGLARSHQCSSTLPHLISMRSVADLLRHRSARTPAVADSASRKSSDLRAAAVQHEEPSARSSHQTDKPELKTQTPISASRVSGLEVGIAVLSQGRANPVPTRSWETESGSGKKRSIAPTSQEDGIANHTRNAQSTTSRYSSPKTLGQGIANLSSMSTELYMLRRRIPRKPGTNQNHQHTTNAISPFRDVQLSAQNNGAASPRLELCDVHAATNGSGRTPAIAATPVSVVGASGKIPQQVRLRGDFKVQDHHGKSSDTAASAPAIPLAAAVIVFAALLFVGTFPTVLVYSAAACYLSFSSFGIEMAKEILVQCTEANSSWLVRLLSKEELENGHALQKRSKHFGSDAAAAAAAACEPWLKGSIYRFAHSPLRFAAMLN